jgi:hypothetical protein
MLVNLHCHKAPVTLAADGKVQFHIP